MRPRVIAHLSADITPVVTGPTIPRAWCPNGRTPGEPAVPDARPGSAIGPRVVVLSAWLPDLLGTTRTPLGDVFHFHRHFKLSPSGLVRMEPRRRELRWAWYREIQAQALGHAVLHTAETGWRVAGKTPRLGRVTTAELTACMIDRCPGVPARPGRGSSSRSSPGSW